MYPRLMAAADGSTYLIRIRQLELPAVTCPADEGLTGFVREQLKQKLPELDGSTTCESRKNEINKGRLCNELPCVQGRLEQAQFEKLAAREQRR